MNKSNTAVRELEILLVEDNVADLLLMAKLLKKSTIKNHVNVVRDGRAALQYLNRVNGFENAPRPDLILLDLSLPYMDGMEVLTAIKENPALSDIPTIILTASDSIDMVSRAYQCKADYYMIKPQDLDQFTASVKYLEETWLKKLKAAPTPKVIVARPKVARTNANRAGMISPTNRAIRPVTVFMVEENMADVVLILEALKVHSRFIELTLAKDRAETVEYLNRFGAFEKLLPPDVILLDLSLSNRSGLEFLAMIRSVAELDQVPLILLTNSDVQRDIRRVYDDPTNFYIKKPHRPDQLFAAIHHVVNSRR